MRPAHEPPAQRAPRHVFPLSFLLATMSAQDHVDLAHGVATPVRSIDEALAMIGATYRPLDLLLARFGGVVLGPPIATARHSLDLVA